MNKLVNAEERVELKVEEDQQNIKERRKDERFN